jgi:hypothetical protein
MPRPARLTTTISAGQGRADIRRNPDYTRNSRRREDTPCNTRGNTHNSHSPGGSIRQSATRTRRSRSSRNHIPTPMRAPGSIGRSFLPRPTVLQAQQRISISSCHPPHSCIVHAGIFNATPGHHVPRKLARHRRDGARHRQTGSIPHRWPWPRRPPWLCTRICRDPVRGRAAVARAVNALLRTRIISLARRPVGARATRRAHGQGGRLELFYLQITIVDFQCRFF